MNNNNETSKDSSNTTSHKTDVMRSPSDEKLIEIAVPINSLILTVNATKHHNRKLFKEWMKDFLDDDVNFA